MKNLFNFFVLVLFALTLSACGRMGDLIPYKGYVPVTEEMITKINTDVSIKSNLEKLSDSELIIQALASGNRDILKFAGSQALDNDIPTYKKDLTNRKEVIDVLFKASQDNNLDSDEQIPASSDIKSNLEKLSDSELIIQALASGNRDILKFAGSQALDNDIPTYKKDLTNRKEVIDVLFKASQDNNLDSDEQIPASSD